MRAEQFIPYMARDSERELLKAAKEFSALSGAVLERLSGKGDFEKIARSMASAAFCLREMQEIFGVGNLELEKRIQERIDGYFSTQSPG